jgi:hypothetical protein
VYSPCGGVADGYLGVDSDTISHSAAEETSPEIA